MDRPLSYLDYPRISHWIDSIAAALRAQRFVAVAAVLRGGLFPAHCAAFVTGAPLVFMRYDRARQRASWHGDLPAPGRVLLCDDLAGHGHTLVNCLALLKQTHPDHRVLTAVSDELSRVRPDWSMHRPHIHTVLPWEREAVSAHYRHDWRNGGGTGLRPMLPDHRYRLWGVDLDGVLCADVPLDRYERDLQAALAERDALPRCPKAPPLTAQQHRIVTGRPLMDRDRTRAWLDAKGYASIEVHHRDPDLHGQDDVSMAAHKAHAALSLQLTDFLESCARQAVLIATRAPHLRVYWWRDGEPVLITALSATR
jgi:hypoxanthine phosphoribosyltransferase